MFTSDLPDVVVGGSTIPAVVLDARTGNVVAMAAQPTYDPSVWVDGIT